ncbi:MAG: CotS family spore coat protein [Burkholderiales bacterium]
MQNESLEGIARAVLTQYDVRPKQIQVVQQGGVKTVWKVTCDNAAVCLKRLKHTLEKALFSVGAQKYIKENGGHVPGIIANKANETITCYNNELFVLYEWVEGKQLNFNRQEDFTAAVEGLARFHKCTKGYIPPEGARVSTKLAKWPDQYRSMLTRLSDWKNISCQKIGIPVYDAYLKWVDRIIALGEKAIQFLQDSQYSTLSSPGSPAVVLCHQDYGKGNALLTQKGICVLDLDGVTYELAARDLRKIILKTAEDRGKWDEQTLRDILTWYERGNKLSADEKKLVYIDTLFPHSFFGTVKNQFLKNKPVKGESIEKIGRLETSKETILTGLISGSSASRKA